VSLRTRLLLALLATSAVTLGVAALALLPPLQTRLERQDRDSVEAAAIATRPALEEALARDRGVVTGKTTEILDTLSKRTNSRLALFDGIPELQATFGIVDPDRRDLLRVIVDGHTIPSSGPDGSGVAIPITPKANGIPTSKLPRSGQFFVLLVRKSASGGNAVDVVRSAFLTAALVGLGVALLLGLVLATTLSRRLGRLRRSALALAAGGVNAPAPPADAGRDEVGDLARALGSMQRALLRQEEARRAFVATASHELRTPITSLQGNLELLAEDLEAGSIDAEDARSQIGGAQEQLRRLANLASELLDLSRLDAGVPLRREPVELGELCRAVAAEFALRARDHDVELTVVPPTGPVWAAGDPGAVARVARILIDNALRFSPRGDAIRIVAAYHGERATLDVSDRGPGVPPQEREAIFERFQRGSRTGGQGGFGLGLAIGRELARQLGGELALLDEPEGAHFRLTLPIELPRGASDRPAAADAEAAARPL
jgi:signal transduction histidine kinase